MDKNAILIFFPVDQFLVALLEDYQILLGEIRGSKEWTLHGRHIGHIPGSVARNEGRYLDVGNNFINFVKTLIIITIFIEFFSQL